MRKTIEIFGKIDGITILLYLFLVFFGWINIYASMYNDDITTSVFDLSTKYGKDDILDFFVANFIADSKKWIGNLLQNDGKDVYLDYKKRKESFAYHFRGDCNSVVNDFSKRGLSFDDGFAVSMGQHPRMLRLLIQRKISYQTAVVLNHFLNFTKNWDKEITEKVVWPQISLKVARVKPFINFNATECKLIMKEIFVND